MATRLTPREFARERPRLCRLTAALLIVLVLLVSDPQFAMLEDESTILTVANEPVATTLHLFFHGRGQHEHPPLSDLLLHFWLPIAAVNPTLARLPSMIFYAVALLVLAEVAQKLAGPWAAFLLMIVGGIWPFGFHFGRTAGWYSFCFLLFASLTLAYLRFREAPSWRRWLAVLVIGFALLTSNYFAWTVVGLMFLDTLLTRRIPGAYKYVVIGCAGLVLAYGPLWRPFVVELHAGALPTNYGWLAGILNVSFNLYALFVSEAVAPWIWWLSVPVCAAIGLVLVCTLLLTDGFGRRLYLGFAILFTVMAVLGIIGTRRLLFISAWLLVPLTIALANRSRPRLHRLLTVSLVVIGIVGWSGIITRKYYAAPRFIEPWAEIADGAAQHMRRGDAVVSNSPSFLFHLNRSLYVSGLSPADQPRWAMHPQLISLVHTEFPAGLKGETLFVRGVNTSETRRTAVAEAWLCSHCRLEWTQKYVPDSGFEFKKRYFRLNGQDPYRIILQQFNCSMSP